MQQSSVRILVNYSRSGGTLLSRVLGSLPGVVLLSEVNPKQNHAPHTDINFQMREWYGVEVEGNSFPEKIGFVQQWCADQGKTLIVRDVSAFDFMPNSTNNFSPAGRFETVHQLSEHFETECIGFVRDAIDVWISRDCPPYFSRHYLPYVQALLDLRIPIFKYESFCRRPEVELPRICSAWSLPCDLTALERFHANHRVTGDNQTEKPSRGFAQPHIVTLERRRIADSLQKHLEDDKNLKQANALLDYPETYVSENYRVAASPPRLTVELKHRVRRLLKRYPAYLE